MRKMIVAMVFVLGLTAHPDRGGSHEAMLLLNGALDQAIAEFGA